MSKQKSRITKLQSVLHFSTPVFVSDIDDCSGDHECHANALCTDTGGSYICECKVGFEGDGRNCTGEQIFGTCMVLKWW